MATNLYETLEIPKDATVEQIRKAYKKRALQTHPDRLPPGATPEEKADSEEQFRKVNNAYEVLSDPQNRRVYDLHGIWPPPEIDTQPLPRRNSQGHHRSQSHHRYRAPRSNTYSDHFFDVHRDPFSFAFTDPFTLFDEIFGAFEQHLPQHHHHHHNHRRPGSTRATDPFSRMQADFGRMEADFERMHADFGNHFNHGVFSNRFPPLPSVTMGFPSLAPVSFSEDNHWTGDTFMTTTVNGVTQSVRKRRDWDGNELITRTYPDGREVHTINGVEQPPSGRGYISHSVRPEGRHLPPSATASQPHITNSRSGTPPSYAPPPYPGHSAGYGNPPMEGDYPRRHDRRYSESRPVIPDQLSSGNGPNLERSETRHRNRWWRGSR